MGMDMHGRGAVMTPDIMRVIREQRLGFVATVGADGVPNLSPTGTFAVVDAATVAFAEIRSPGTVRNLAADPAVAVNFVDPFARRGCRLTGTALVSPAAVAFGQTGRGRPGCLELSLTPPQRPRHQRCRGCGQAQEPSPRWPG